MENENENRSMMNDTYGESKLDKSIELNETMSISESSQDEYTTTIKTIGGK